MSRRAFTLIELLVVIAIIALLASIVVAALNSVRDKGRIAGAQSFAAQVDHIAGDYAVGIWDLNECGGNNVADRSGSGNNGSFVGTGGPTWQTDTPIGSGCSILFDGSTQYINTSAAPLGAGDGTVSVWFKAGIQNDGTASGVRPIVAQGTQVGLFGLFHFSLVRPTSPAFPNGIICNWGDDANQINVATVYTDSRWHNATCVRVGSTLVLYVDGQKVGTGIPGTPNATTNLQIGGSSNNVDRKFKGLIDNVHVFAKGLTASEIGKLYAEGLSRHRLAEAK